MSAQPPRAHSSDNAHHEAIASWFLGPKAENHQVMRDAFNGIVDDLKTARLEYHPEDGEFITDAVKSSTSYNYNKDKMQELLSTLSQYMAEHNIPFYSPRYNGHMNADLSLPGTLGYMMTMLYNPNNVAPESSPVTSMIEYWVGQDLCEVLGYRRASSTVEATAPSSEPVGWGHICSGGSIANLESMWVARNLKYYPLALRNAMAPGAPFHYISPTFRVRLCSDEPESEGKLFADCDTWELLNLDPTTVLDLAPRMTSEYGMSSPYVQKVMADYIIQTVAKDKLDKQFDIEKAPVYFASSTSHYSWPKCAAITGIGSENMRSVTLDNRTRMNTEHLNELLEECLQERRAVYAVVSIAGTTEHGAVDPLDEILRLRKKFQKRGLSFLVHVDAAWGGYFATLLRDEYKPNGQPSGDSLEPSMTLLPYTRRQLEHMKDADSVTIDPHKSGHIPYPAGGLCYRDGRARFLVTWTSPYIDFQEEGVQTMGTYGVEGSKPGASAVAAWMSHKTIGLHKNGYGSVLGEAIFTSTKFYCHWATMEDKDLIVVPFNMLPSETKPGATEVHVQAEKQFIRERILKPANHELLADSEAMRLLSQLGGDLMINVFACNFRINGELNSNITEANNLNAKIYERVAVLHARDKAVERDVWVMSTVLKQSYLGDALTHYKRRLSLEGDDDLFVLVNVSMSPFPTETKFISSLAEAFKQTANEVIHQSCIPRNIVVPDYHTFIMQGTNPVYLVSLPMFHMANFREQLILCVDLPEDVRQAYIQAREDNPGAVFSISTASEDVVSDILLRGSFKANMDENVPTSRDGLSDPDASHFQSNFKVSNVHVVRRRSLESTLLDAKYPSHMPFFLYGNKEQMHLDHILMCSPNVQLSSDQVKLDLHIDSGDFDLDTELEDGLIAVLEDIREEAMQPFGAGHDASFFRPNRTFRVSLHRDPSICDPEGFTGPDVLARGTVTLGSSVFRDFDKVNRDITALTKKVRKTAMPEFEAFKKFITGDGDCDQLRVDMAAVKTAPAPPQPTIVQLGEVQIADRYQVGAAGDRKRDVGKRSAFKVSCTNETARAQ
ncbi:hypothetical protein EUX98_g6038 [Antrodiella citrinella]|uniref:Uncharacterized protein n=1 Tax=Antrodiella citrinella TaxID=2447956 RepID=A0A4S4MXL2_9APHY|nr:hypothetical protein EUX98_g6038 [Antrodiella citrinella]